MYYPNFCIGWKIRKSRCRTTLTLRFGLLKMVFECSIACVMWYWVEQWSIVKEIHSGSQKYQETGQFCRTIFQGWSSALAFFLARLFSGSALAFFVMDVAIVVGNCCQESQLCKSACMYLKICRLQFWVPILVAKGPYLVPISWKLGP